MDSYTFVTSIADGFRRHDVTYLDARRRDYDHIFSVGCGHCYARAMDVVRSLGPGTERQRTFHVNLAYLRNLDKNT